MLSRVVRSEAVHTFGGLATSQALVLVSFLVIGSDVSTAVFGTVVLSTTLASVCVLAADFGGAMKLIRGVASSSEPLESLLHAANSRAVLAAIGALAVSVAITFSAGIGLWFATAIYAMSLEVLTSLGALLRGLYGARAANLALVLPRGAQLGALLWFRPESAAATVLCLSAGLVVMEGVLAITLRRERVPALGLVRLGRPFSGQRDFGRLAAAVGLRQLGVPIAAATLGPHDLGLYGFAQRMLGGAQIGQQSLVLAQMPAEMRSPAQTALASVRRVWRHLVLLEVGLVGATALVPIFLSVYGGGQFQGGTVVLQLMLMSLMLAGPAAVVQNWQIASGRERVSANVQSAGTVLFLVLFPLLTLGMGLNGAGIASLVTEAVILLLLVGVTSMDRFQRLTRTVRSRFVVPTINGIQRWGLVGTAPRRLLIALIGVQGAVSKRASVSSGCFFGGGPVTMGRGVFINVGTFLDGSAAIELGEGVRVGPEVLLLTGTHRYRNSVIRRSVEDPTIGLPITIDRGCWVGARSVIMPGVHVAEGCVIAAGSVVIHDTEPNGLYGGVPARRIRDLSTEDDDDPT